MYTQFGDPMLAQMISNEKTSPKREGIELANPGVLFNTIRNRVSRWVEGMLSDRELQGVPERVRVVACQEMPQYC